MEEASIIVGRDRAHVRELLQQEPWAEVISASAFFDKVRSLAFIYDPDLRRDDYAPLVFAQNIIARTQHCPLSYARNCATLYSSFYHGTMSPNEVYQKLIPHNPSYMPIVQILDAIDEAMKKKSLVNGVSALYAAWQIIEQHKIVPLSLHKSRVSLRSLIDLTALEIEVIKSLSRCGIRFDICFPLDFEKRSFNVPVEHAARHFEKAQDLNLIDLSFEYLSTDGPLGPLVSGILKENTDICLHEDYCSITKANSIIDEAYGIAQKIAHIKTNFKEQKIALVVRTIDDRSAIYKRVLLAHNISVKDRKGISLTETPAGIFLKTLFSARESSIARGDFVSLICHPISCFLITDNEKRGNVISLLRDLGIDESALVPFKDSCRYRYAVDTAKRVWAGDDVKIEQLNELNVLLEKMNSHLSVLKGRARLGEYLDACLFLMANCCVKLDGSVEVVSLAIKKIKNSSQLSECESEISFGEFKTFIANELKALTIAHADQPDVYAVEFLMLPELLGRKFDHVFIADISFGRMPQNSTPDPLLSDEQRIHLNKLLEKEVLRVFFDDPFEPMLVPPRQALEPFWFASALASAEKSIHFSCALFDQNGSEQAGSEFFVWLLEHVTIEKTKNLIPHYVSMQNARFNEGQKATILGDTIQDSAQALWQRKRMFKEQKSGPFAGEFSKSVIERLFKGRIGVSPHRPLTPTMLENFSACAFYGLFHRILKIEKEVFHNDELDHRALGQIAHQALQNYFTVKNKRNFSEILERVSQEYLEKNYVARPEVFYCQIEGLDYLLKRLVHNLSENYPSNPFALEMPFGLGDGQAAVPIGKNRNYFLGGVIDRIDKTGSSVSIIDYKLSSIPQLRLNASESALMKSNFQIPIYMRLVASLFSQCESLEFFYASIRDGEIVRVLSHTNEEIMKKILNDNEEGSLASAIENILSPIEEGQLIAQIGDRCSLCAVHSVCRKAEA